MYLILRFALLLVVVGLFACGGGSSNKSHSSVSNSSLSTSSESSSTSSESSSTSSESSSISSVLPTLTGSFFGGKVIGLRYETPTESGLTSEAGEFTYREGETVSFSLGRTIIGSAPGAVNLTPFDLFSMAPPSTELAIRAELNNKNNISDFDRVANITLFLVAFDKDSNTANGLDLSGWDETLSDHSPVSFESSLYYFYTRELAPFTEILELQRFYSIADPLVYLYEVLGIVIPAHQLRRVEERNNDTNRITELSEFSYDAQGRFGSPTIYSSSDQLTRVYDDIGNVESVIYHAVSYTFGADYFEKYFYTYDHFNNVISSLAELDGNGYSTRNRLVTTDNTYNDFGMLLTSEESTINEVGLLSGVVVKNYTYVFNENNLIESSMLEQRNANNELCCTQRDSYEYTALGSISFHTNNYEDDEIGARTQTREYAYDDNGFMVSIKLERHVDYELPDGFDYRNYSFTYDENGVITTLVMTLPLLPHPWPYTTRYAYTLVDDGLSHLIYAYQDPNRYIFDRYISDY